MSLVVRVIAPTGRDAELIVALLRSNNIASQSSSDLDAVLREAASHPIGPLMVAEECLTSFFTQQISQLLYNQPPWSDLPLLILTGGGKETVDSRRKSREYRLGSPVLLERPIRTETLLSSVRAALRARQRQYEVRDALQDRDRALAELRKEQEALTLSLMDLRRSEERFRRLIENASVGVNISDFNGKVSYVNPALLHLLGYEEEDVHKGVFHWDKLTPPEFAEVDARAMGQLRTTGVAQPYQKMCRARDGHLVPVLLSATVIPGAEHGRAEEIAIFLHDLTRQKQAETALINSEKLAAVGRLAASISHEINNPLESVTNLLYLISGEELTPKARKYLVTAEQELARVSQITGQTLRFHRQSTRPRPVSPKEIVEPTLALYHGRLINSNIEVVQQHRCTSTVTCYEGDIRQVLNNLVGNAIDAMRNGGCLTVRTSNACLWSSGTPGVRITIADTGHGMPPATLRRLFEAFYTTKGINGTGLGLWISQGIVQKHHGRLQVHSSIREGKSGTVFSLFLPMDATPEDSGQVRG